MGSSYTQWRLRKDAMKRGVLGWTSYCPGVDVEGEGEGEEEGFSTCVRLKTEIELSILASLLVFPPVPPGKVAGAGVGEGAGDVVG
jgi:hypothetical protein